MNSSLFRAELRKELSFYRGCNATYQCDEDGSVHVIAEGKTTQLSRFVSWLGTLEKDIANRKRSFQSPYLAANVSQLTWEPYRGTDCLPKGFAIVH